MTYQEKYEELRNKVEQTGKKLTGATEKLASTNGFGDMSDLPNYYLAIKEFKRAEWAFQNILKYAQSGSLNPEAEFIPQQYMYNVIKRDQQERGVPWPEEVITPKVGNGIKLFSGKIGLTNDPDVHEINQAVEYKFSVVDLIHGKECYVYLSSMLGAALTEEQIEGLNFQKVLDVNQPIFVKVELTIMP